MSISRSLRIFGFSRQKLKPHVRQTSDRVTSIIGPCIKVRHAEFGTLFMILFPADLKL